MALSNVFLRHFNNKCRYLRFLQEQHCKVFTAFHTASNFPSFGYKRWEAKSVTLKSSRPLQEDVPGCVPQKPSKSKRRYVVFGDVSVDEETYSKMQAESNDQLDDMDDEDLQNILQNSEKFYDLFKSEESNHRSYIRQKTLERKLFPRQVEPCLITWAAREQIRYLHGLDPEEWTAEEISKHFPVSPLGAKKLIASSFKYASKERIERHDKSVHAKWRKISKGEISDLDQNLQERWLKRQLKPNQALPNPTLPLPPHRDPNPAPFLLDDPNRPVGEFYALVKPYVDIVRKNEEQKLEALHSKSWENSEPNFIACEDERESRNTVSSAKFLDDEIDEDVERRERHLMKKMTHVTHQHFKDNLKEELQLNQYNSEEDAQMLAWMEKQNNFLPSENAFNKSVSKDEENEDRVSASTVTKFKENVKVTYDTPKDGGRSEAYLYNSSTGYQHPFGKHNANKDKIRINSKMEKEDGLYKVGDSFYTENGEFVFRVFTK